MNKTNRGSWVQFTKRTEDPKLAWLEKQLAAAGIQSRRHGASWHAPILQVRKRDLSAARAILDPVDDVADDDPMFDLYDPDVVGLLLYHRSV